MAVMDLTAALSCIQSFGHLQRSLLSKHSGLANPPQPQHGPTGLGVSGVGAPTHTFVEVVKPIAISTVTHMATSPSASSARTNFSPKAVDAAPPVAPFSATTATENLLSHSVSQPAVLSAVNSHTAISSMAGANEQNNNPHTTNINQQHSNSTATSSFPNAIQPQHALKPSHLTNVNSAGGPSSKHHANALTPTHVNNLNTNNTNNNSTGVVGPSGTSSHHHVGSENEQQGSSDKGYAHHHKLKSQSQQQIAPSVTASNSFHPQQHAAWTTTNTKHAASGTREKENAPHEANNTNNGAPQMQSNHAQAQQQAHAQSQQRSRGGEKLAPWVEPRALRAALLAQTRDPDTIFRLPAECDLDAIFADTQSYRRRPRTSSGRWSGDHFTKAEDREYKAYMGWVN